MAAEEHDEKVRLGGMALLNGVLVHGPNAWACAVRTPAGELKVASAYKSLRANQVGSPLLRGPVRFAEMFALLPAIRRQLPEARLPFQRTQVVGAMIASALAVRVVRGSRHLTPLARELVSGLISAVPATLALRGSDLAAYHGAEHISIGTYEHDSPREREHERCGSHMLAPLLISSAIGGAVASRAPAHMRASARLLAQLGALAATTEIFGWMVRNPDHRLAQALARPGHELQHRYATAEPTPQQLEVAEAALAACLELERKADGADPN